ncbi:hypothetical protein EYF80_047673 [Liparis tanakae]|uniref:Uncharacterized protein n=1 Tax=Liparis tanakae TaxID=230148 RepID=A0A4Z2FLM2_9TELE|nr:hypothetical protein EYF80_047673 [Liparis tanakae]
MVLNGQNEQLIGINAILGSAPAGMESDTFRDRFNGASEVSLTGAGHCMTPSAVGGPSEYRAPRLPGARFSVDAASSRPSSEPSSVCSTEPALDNFPSTEEVGLSSPPLSRLWTLEWRTSWW